MTASELTVRNLFVTRGGRPVLRDVSISVAPG
jgi:ABC-type molybdenum transport system ATPase subunit/photorepair protein PhrA